MATDQVYLGTVFTNNDPDSNGLLPGSLVQLDPTMDNAVIKVTGGNSPDVIGVIIVGGSKGSQVTVCGFTGQRLRFNIDGAAAVSRGDQLVSDGTILGNCKVDNGATPDEVFAVALAAKVGGVGSQVEALYLSPSVSNAIGTGASANAYYLVSQATNAPVNAINLGALTTGFLKATVGSGIATISTDTAVGAPETSKYIVQQPDGSLPNAQALSALSTGILKSTTTTGVVSIAVINTDYPAVTATYIVASNVAAPPNAVNLGALTTGLLKQTVGGGVATISIGIAGTDYAAPGNYITALTSDVTATGPGSAAATIAAHAVTYAKMQQASGNTLLGNPTGSTANISEITLGAGLTFSGSTLIGTNPITVENSGTPVTQRSTLNFSIPLQAIDNIGATRTDISILTNGISSALFRQSVGTSVVGNPTGSTANVQDIVAGSDGQFLGRTAGALSFSSVPYSSLSGAPTIFYQTVEITGGALTQRSILNFSAEFGVVDNGGATRTDVSINSIASPKISGTANTLPWFDGAGAMQSSATTLGYDATNIRVGSRVSSGLPLYQFHIVDETGSSDRGITSQSSFASTAGMASRMLKSRGSFASPATVVSGDYLGRYEFAPYTPSGGFVTTAVVGAQASGTTTGALAPTRLYLAAASGGVSSDPFGSNNVGLYLNSNNSGTPPLVTIPSLNQGVSSVIATVNNGGALSTSPNLAFSSGMFRVGAQSGTAGGPTPGAFLASVQGAAGTPPPILAIIGLDTSTSPHLQLYGPWNGALTYMDQTYVAPGSAEATKYGFSNVFVFDALQQRGAPSLTDAVPTVFWGISALGGTQFPAFALDGYGASQWANSSAPISSSGYSRVRSNAGHLQYSQNGGAWTNFDAALTAAYQTVESNLVNLTQRPILNLGVPSSTGLSGVDNPGNTSTDVTNTLVTGLAGGQTVVGGTATGNTLTIKGNNFDTNGGEIFFNDSSNFLTRNVPSSFGAQLTLNNFVTLYGGVTGNGANAGLNIGSSSGPAGGAPITISVSRNGGIVSSIVNTSVGASAYSGYQGAVSASGPVFLLSMSGTGTAAPYVTQLSTSDSSSGLAIPLVMTPATTSGSYFAINTGGTERVRFFSSGEFRWAETGAPGTPASGFGYAWFDSTKHGPLWAKGPAGVATHTVGTFAAISHNFLTAIDDDGTVHAAQPSYTDISGSVPAITSLTGDVTGTGPGATATTIATNVVTYAKMQQASAHTLLGNPTGSTANISEITLGAGLAFSGTTLTVTVGTGTVTNVTGTAPIFVATGSTTPVISIHGSITSGDTTTAPQNLGALTSGVLKQTVTTGVATLAIATAGTDYVQTVSATSPITNVGTSANPDFALSGGIVSGSSSTTPQNLGSLTSGLLKQSVSVGIATISTATAGSDYVTSVSVTAPITNTGTSANPIIGHATSGVGASAYATPNITVDADGHVTLAASVNTYQTIESAGAPLTQRPTLNFGPAFGVLDSTMNNRTNVSLLAAATDLSGDWPTISVTSIHEVGGAQLAIGSIPSASPDVAVLVREASGPTIIGIPLSALLSGTLPFASYKFSLNTAGSVGILSNQGSVIVPGDSGAITTSAGIYTATLGTGIATTLGANYGTTGGVCAYRVNRNATTFTFQVTQLSATVAVANGANVTYALYSSSSPFSNSWTQLASWSTGIMTVGTIGNSGLLSGVISGSCSVAAEDVIVVVAYRTDVVPTSTLSNLMFSATVDLMG